MPRAILIFARAPELGRVKTRLAAEIGAEAALRVYVHLARHAVHEALALAPEVAVRIHVAGTGEAGRWLGERPEYVPQAAGDLGERLDHAFARAFAEGFDRVLVIGSDLPDLSAELLRRAFARLEQRDAVLGPAHDGGYYLLGLRYAVPELFRDVAWSTPAVFGATLAHLRTAGIESAILETLRDVDEVEDLPAAWRAECGVT